MIEPVSAMPIGFFYSRGVADKPACTRSPLSRRLDAWRFPCRGHYGDAVPVRIRLPLEGLEG